jgi:hypothetical protein
MQTTTKPLTLRTLPSERFKGGSMTPPLTYDRPFANRTLSRRDPQTTGELVQTTDLVGASRKRVNQVMAIYKNLKLIAVDPSNRITILNRERLAEQCR